MTTSLYDLSIPVFTRSLHNLSAILEKGRAFADAQGMDHAVLLEARLVADMAPLTAQIQRASDSAKGAAVRIGGVPNVVMEDNETTFAQLQDRIAATIAFLDAVPRAAIDGSESATVELVTPNGTFPFTGLSYVLGFATPNIYFHVTTAYALLRMHGVPVGKLDFLGGI
jgi:hypothetical protein